MLNIKRLLSRLVAFRQALFGLAQDRQGMLVTGSKLQTSNLKLKFSPSTPSLLSLSSLLT